jgi:hypothetical protein
VFARSRKSACARAETAPRIRSEASEREIKHGYVERVGNAYRVTDKVNIPELQSKLQRRIDMVSETAKRLPELGGKAQQGRSDLAEVASTHNDGALHKSTAGASDD